MSALTKRKWIDFLIIAVVTEWLFLAGAGWQAFPLCTALAVWNYYDGKTRDTLRT